MVYMYRSFLTHSSADGHLGCVHVLAMINSAGDEHWGARVFQIWFPWCVCPEVGLLGHIGLRNLTCCFTDAYIVLSVVLQVLNNM